MDHLSRGPRVVHALLIAVVASLALSACGSSSSGDAASLIRQTFTGTHAVNSGNLSFNVTVGPSGSSTLKGPITLGFGGPFQSLGKGRLPESNFNISISALGRTGSLGILSTGTSGYISLSGTSYQLPAATFQKLQSSFTQVASGSGSGTAAGSGSGALSKLGIDPLHWLVNPSIVGTETVAGASTTHIRAGVNVVALLGDLSTFLQKASSLGVSGATRLPTSLSAATRNRIAGKIKSPTFDVWTGTSDKTVRKLAITLTLPVSGQTATLLGGLSSAQIALTVQYANLNQPQTIQAPATVRPFSEFTTKLRSLLGNVQALSGLTGAGTALGSSSSSGSSGSPSAPSAAGANVQSYSQCIQAAGTDVIKMQRCAKLLSGK